MKLTTSTRTRWFWIPLTTVLLVTIGLAGVRLAFLGGPEDDADASLGLPRTAIDVANNNGVVKLKTVASSPHASVVTGVQAGDSVVAVALANSSTPFAPRTRLFASSDLAVRSAFGGRDADSADWLAVAGIASPRVSRVEVAYRDGGSAAVELSPDGAFAADLDIAKEPQTVVGYDADGNVIARQAVLFTGRLSG